jgi:hypothetical protein
MEAVYKATDLVYKGRHIGNIGATELDEAFLPLCQHEPAGGLLPKL